jgi:DNA mismatch repair protein MutS2
MSNGNTDAFQVGDMVFISSIQANGRVVEVLSQDVYRVAIRSLHITVKSSDLCATRGESLNERLKERNISIVTCSTHKTKSSIDLHGLSVADACNALEQWLNAQIVSASSHGKVIHGLGSGKVQRASHEMLSRYSAVRAFRINDANPGETDVYFDADKIKLKRST